MRFYLCAKKYLIREQANAPGIPLSKLSSFETPPLNPLFHFCRELQATLDGKKLLLDEILAPFDLIQQHYENGYLTFHPGITSNKNGHTCTRCGNKEPYLFGSHYCARCQDNCVYCRKCITMGKVSECRPLVTWLGPSLEYPSQKRSLKWQGHLSEGQQLASEKIVQRFAHTNSSQKQLLVWAVCGSGKTEILFEGISRAIELRQKALIATPRTDVVLELAPRLRAVFPTVSILSLYGGSEDRGKQGQIVIATTHQLLRYYDQFDFVVIDEVDAFPFSFDPMLQHAARQASKRTAITVLLTATPSQEMKKQIAKHQLDVVKIPKRYHGHPLPIPTFRWAGNWRKQLEKKKLPPVVETTLRSALLTKKQLFCFVPSVTVLHQLVPILQTIDPNIEGVHAEDKERREKVQRFREGATPILVTTTILERGVTVANVDVLVFGADDDVFSESALVQICGRVGRSAKHPTGAITFFHYGKTQSMLDAVRHIVTMNRLGGF